MLRCDKCRSQGPLVDLGTATHALKFSFGGFAVLCSRCANLLVHELMTHQGNLAFAWQKAMCEALEMTANRSVIDATAYAEAKIRLEKLEVPLLGYLIQWLGPKPKGDE